MCYPQLDFAILCEILTPPHPAPTYPPALTMFEGDELNEAMGVPFLYGVAEIAFISIFCVWAWKMGWTKAPANESICKVIVTAYEIETSNGLLDEDEVPSSSANSKDDRGDGESTVAATAFTDTTAIVDGESQSTVAASTSPKSPVATA